MSASNINTVLSLFLDLFIIHEQRCPLHITVYLTRESFLAHHYAMKTLCKKYGFAVLSGLLLALSFPAWGGYPLAWVALVPLLYQTVQLTPHQAAGRFLLAGWVFHSLLLQWLMTNVYWAGGWAFVGYQALCFYLALYWAAIGWLWVFVYRSWTSPQNPLTAWISVLAMALLWPAMEYIQAYLFTGFGWGAIAYSQGRDLLVLQWAAMGGTGLIAAVIAGINALLALAVLKKSWKRIGGIATALLLIAMVHGVGWLLLGQPDYTSRPFNVAIVQPDFPLEMKWDSEYTVEMVRNSAEKSRALIAHKPADLIVWPEAQLMGEIDTPAIRTLVSSLVKDTNAYLYTGAVRINPVTNGYPNSSYLVSPDGRVVDYYDKVHLAPFGEYVPLGQYLPFLRSVVPAMGDVEFGADQKIFPVKEHHLGPLICFEVLFANLTERLRSMGADHIAVITNLGWFGASNAIPQELELARMRAVETRLPIIHGANTGVSGVFDPWGRFTMVNGSFSHSGRFMTFTQPLPVDAIIMQRVGGVLPVAAPATRPTPIPPWTFSWLMMGGAIVLLIFTAVRRKNGVVKKAA